ncbi:MULTISPECIES: LysM peptidoglycan-binding domain-containing protein [unclassified Candidatus Frackibacter]|uniref:LysM peptidoglycan-binding domain-containing protein n=1 Tax=unclassified Candidatus Frackibacter TaxID=2648818 RepID=UPI000B7F4C44|nr:MULTISPECIES: LysM peptidoglycan-binding domain-containing protein [unclassified Candidatus Frackibacter]
MKMIKRHVNSYPCSRRKRDKNNNENKAILNVGLVLIICTFMFIFITQSVISTGPVELKEIQVKPGDTLWSIVQRHYSVEVDIRRTIYQIKKVNNLASANLKPYQRLKLPIKK